MDRDVSPLPWDKQQDPVRDAAIDAFASSLDPSDPFVVMFRDAILPMAISDPTLADNPVIYVNDAFVQLTGYPRDEVVGRNCRFLQGPLTDAADMTCLRDAIARRVRIEIDLLNHRRDGTPFWNRLLVAPVFDGRGEARYFIASQHDVTLERVRLVRLEAEQREMQAAADRSRMELADSASRLGFALRAARLGAWTLEPASRLLDATDGCKAVFGRSPADAFGYDEFFGAIHPDDRDRVLAAFEATASHGADYDVEHRIVLPTGETRWIAIRGELLSRRDGSPLSISGFSTDITERKRVEEHRALLAGELTHRVKNTLATVSAIVNQTLRNATSMSEARDAIGGRIASLAVAHDLLLRDEVDGASIGDIVGGVMAPFNDERGRQFTVSGPDVCLEPRVTLALSMALHELATNASKYGALSLDGGHVTIGWSVGTAAGGRHLAFRWQEEGGPPVSPPERMGFGSKMIERVLAQHLRGDVKVDYRREGLVFTIDAPL
ncbi:PAS domain-containing protein [Sphingomonas bacterium]|uniref:PAS domain-containing protein n=1 Tax=Sphingomonas bacterium TaxID=1895847 RepID=UPI0020C5CB89|nr:PAS domain-containing protein [Sphingomonas bacterium]